jgi:uncharacterized protein
MASTYYADSSVLVKRHVQEIGSNWFRQLTGIGTDNLIVTASFSLVEVYSALNRRKRELNLNYADYVQIAADFTQICTTEYQLIEFNKHVIDRSQQLLESYPLRAGDAIQLACALIANKALQVNQLPELIFLASDARLLDAAHTENLTIDDPLLHP